MRDEGAPGAARTPRCLDDVEVVVPTIGRPSLAVLLEALAAQPLLPRRVLLVDDRREPAGPLPIAGTPGPLAGRIEELQGPARGPAAVRNLGWRAATSPWVVFIDDDVVPGPGWAEQLADDLARLPEGTVACQGRIRVPLPTGRRPTDRERTVAGLETAAWITADFAVRRDALEQVGGLDERFPRAYREDTDLVLRLLANGAGLTRGRRAADHPVLPAPWWISVKQQAGNRDDVLMDAIHGPGWRTGLAPRGRRSRHRAIVAAAALVPAALLWGHRRAAAVAAGAWLVGTAELAWARIEPGPRTPREVAAMTATSVAIPFAATWHWTVGRLSVAGRRVRPWRGPAGQAAADPASAASSAS